MHIHYRQVCTPQLLYSAFTNVTTFFINWQFTALHLQSHSSPLYERKKQTRHMTKDSCIATNTVPHYSVPMQALGQVHKCTNTRCIFALYQSIYTCIYVCIHIWTHTHYIYRARVCMCVFICHVIIYILRLHSVVTFKLVVVVVVVRARSCHTRARAHTGNLMTARGGQKPS